MGSLSLSQRLKDRKGCAPEPFESSRHPFKGAQEFRWGQYSISETEREQWWTHRLEGLRSLILDPVLPILSSLQGQHCRLTTPETWRRGHMAKALRQERHVERSPVTESVPHLRESGQDRIGRGRVARGASVRGRLSRARAKKDISKKTLKRSREEEPAVDGGNSQARRWRKVSVEGQGYCQNCRLATVHPEGGRAQG